MKTKHYITLSFAGYLLSIAFIGALAMIGTSTLAETNRGDFGNAIVVALIFNVICFGYVIVDYCDKLSQKNS